MTFTTNDLCYHHWYSDHTIHDSTLPTTFWILSGYPPSWHPIQIIVIDIWIIWFIMTHDFTYGMSCHTWYALIAHFAPPYVLSPCRISTCDHSHSHMSIIQLWWPIASLSSYDCRHPHASYPNALTLGLEHNAIKSPSDDLLHSIHTPCHPWIWNTVKSSSVIKIWYMRLDSMQDPYHHDLPYMVMSMTHDSLWLPCDLYQITMTLQPRCNPWTTLDHLMIQRNSITIMTGIL